MNEENDIKTLNVTNSENELVDVDCNELNDIGGEEDISNLETWEMYGFLEDISDEQKLLLVAIYEAYIKEITTNINFISEIDKISQWSEVLNSFYEFGENFDILEMIMFPLIKRVFISLNGNVTWKEIQEALLQTNLSNFHKKDEGIASQLKDVNLSTSTVDYEVTLCALYADIITAKIMIKRKKRKQWKI